MDNMLFSTFPNGHFVNLGLYQYGWERYESPHPYGPFVCNHYLPHYVISSIGMLQSTDSKGITSTYQIRSGEGFMVYPKQASAYCADKKYPWKYIWVEFDRLRVKEVLEPVGLTVDSPVYRSFARDLNLELKNETLYVVRYLEQSPFHLIGHLYLFLNYLIYSCAPCRRFQSDKLQDFYIREATSFIEQNFQNGISVEDTAAFCNLNRNRFGKIFRDAVGKSPQELLIGYRMIKVAELLKLTDLMIGDINDAVGYPS